MESFKSKESDTAIWFKRIVRTGFGLHEKETIKIDKENLTVIASYVDANYNITPLELSFAEIEEIYQILKDLYNGDRI